MAELTKSDIKKEVKASYTTSEFKTKVEKIVKDRIKHDKDLEDKIVEITKNVMRQLYKALWMKSPQIITPLKNKKV
jgi:hypothetical protein